MKTVSGKIISSEPISLSKATRVLSTFISAETGASQAVSAYIRRASAAFNELTRLHKELKASRYERKHRKHRSYTINSVENSRGAESVFEGDPNLDWGREQSHGGSKGEVLDGNEENDSLRKREKTKKMRGDFGNFGENWGEVEDGEREVEGRVEKRRKRKSVEVEGAGRDDSEARHSKKKRRRSEGDD